MFDAIIVKAIAARRAAKSHLMQQIAKYLAGHEGQHVHDVHAGQAGHSGQVKNSSYLCILVKETLSKQKVLEVKYA